MQFLDYAKTVCRSRVAAIILHEFLGNTWENVCALSRIAGILRVRKQAAVFKQLLR